MKKLAIAAVLVLAACGTKKDESAAADSMGMSTMTTDTASMMHDTTAMMMSDTMMKKDSMMMKKDAMMARDTAKMK